MDRRVTLIALGLALGTAGCAVSSPAHMALVRAQTGHWGRRTTLAGAHVYVGSPQISLSGGGKALAAWIQGPPPRVFSGPPVGVASSAGSPRERIVADLGSIADGFRRPVPVARSTRGYLSALTSTISGGGVAYLAWEHVPSTGLSLAVLRGGRVLRAAHLIRRDAVPLGLFPLARGRAALVWDQYGHGFPFIKYAAVSPSGRLGHVITVAHPGGRDEIPVQLSVNSSGVLAPAWTHGGGIALRRGKHVAASAARAVLVVCSPAGGCSKPTAFRLGRTRPACVNAAVAVSPSGTVHLVAAATGATRLGCSRPLGVWSVTAAPGRLPGSARRVFAAGDWPVLTSSGRAGAVAVFNPKATADRLVWSRINSSGHFSQPRRLPDRDTINSPVLAGTATGRFLIVWEHASSHVNPRISVRAAVGRGSRIGRSQRIISPPVSASTVSAAIDAAGDRIIIWNQYRSTASSSGSFGAFVRVYRGR